MENETPQIEEKYRRLYRSYETEDKKRSYDLFVRQDKDRTTVSTIQGEKIAEGEEKTISVFLREENHIISMEVWTGFVGDALKKYERQYTARVDYDIGTLFMSEIYDNALRINNRTPSVAKVSEKIVDFAKMHREKQKSL